MKPLLAACALLLALMGTGYAQLTGVRAGEDWPSAWIPQWEMSLRIPRGWLLDCPREGDTARILSPQGTEVLVRVWTGPTALTPAEAAAEYEQALGLQDIVDPPPQPLHAAGGLQGVWVDLPETGVGRPLLACVVFSTGARRLALAVRGIPGFEQAAKQRLEAMAASLRVPPGPPAQPAVTPPVVPPPTPPPPPPTGGTSTTTSGPLTLTIPAAAKVSVERGTLWVDYPQGKAGYFLWPVRTEPDSSLADLPALWGAATGQRFTLGGQRRTRDGVVYTGALTREAPLRAVLFAWQQGPSALLLGVYGQVGDWEYVPNLARLLGQATCSGWRAAAAPLPATPLPWVGANAELSLRLPENWEARGSVRQYQKESVIDFTARGEDMLVSWRQPYTPAFRDLTPILEAMRQKEGERYREDDQEDFLLILRRRDPEQFLAWLLQQPEEGWDNPRIVRAEANPVVAALLPGLEGEREGAIIWVSGTRDDKPRERLYLCAAASLPLERGAFRWQAAVISVDFPPGQASSALAALRALLAGAGPVRATSDAGKAVTAAAQAVAAAAQVTVLPTGLGPWPLLGADCEPVAEGQAPQWSVTPGLAAWRALVGDPEGLPELKAE